MSLFLRTDHVGSLLRPAKLLEARRRRDAGELDAAGFKAIEDEAVREVVSLQERCGCRVITDGELRRDSFQSELTAACDGFLGVTMDAWLWGDWHSEELGAQSTARPVGLAVATRLRKRRSLATEEFTFLRSATRRPTKVTLPSPSLFASLWDPDISGHAYPTLDDFLRDVVSVLRDEVRELARLGCTYIQLDAPHYPLLVDPSWQAFYAGRGWPLERWLSHGVELDNEVIGAASGVTFGFHLCRGNQRSRWLVSGGYEPIARALFQNIQARRLLLEYDDERSGGFSPLDHVRDDQVVVLGLVTTKTRRIETVGELSARIQEASRHVPLERLALGTQCGFASSVIGNEISIEDERRKLSLIAETAAEIWRDA